MNRHELERAEAEIEVLLAETPAGPPGFADRVMLRVAATPQRSPRVLPITLVPLSPVIPWWVRVALEPASVLALLLIAVLMWRGDTLFALAAGIAQLGIRAPAQLPAAAPRWSNPAVATCVVLGVAPLVILASQQLYRWSASLVGPPHLKLRPR